jgi:hypothetical protein
MHCRDMAPGFSPVIPAFPRAQASGRGNAFFHRWPSARTCWWPGPTIPSPARLCHRRYGLAKQLATWAVTLGELLAAPPPAEETVAVADAADGFPGVAGYWENRYADGGTSGAGSSGRLGAFKARVLNAFVAEQAVGSVGIRLRRRQSARPGRVSGLRRSGHHGRGRGPVPRAARSGPDQSGFSATSPKPSRRTIPGCGASWRCPWT